MINAYHRYDVLALSYVLKAREKGLYKPVFHCLCVKDSVIYATDGRRCHFLKWKT